MLFCIRKVVNRQFAFLNNVRNGMHFRFQHMLMNIQRIWKEILSDGICLWYTVGNTSCHSRNRKYTNWNVSGQDNRLRSRCFLLLVHYLMSGDNFMVVPASLCSLPHVFYQAMGCRTVYNHNRESVPKGFWQFMVITTNTRWQWIAWKIYATTAVINPCNASQCIA